MIVVYLPKGRLAPSVVVSEASRIPQCIRYYTGSFDRIKDNVRHFF